MRFSPEFRCLVPVKLKYFLLQSFPEPFSALIVPVV